MGSKSRKSSKSPILTCIWAFLLLFFILAISYTLFALGPDLHLVQALGSWASRSSSAIAPSTGSAHSSSNIFLKMTSTSFNPTRHQELLEENRAVITFKENQVYVSCPPCNSSSTGLYNPRDTPGLSIRCLTPSPTLTLLLAIFTQPSSFELRSLLRMAYSLQTTPTASIDVVFVIGDPPTQQDTVYVGLESRLFNDIVMVDTQDRAMATHHFLSKISNDTRFKHDYVMKIEDDSYVRLANLVRSLMDQPRQDLYYGYVLPCENEDAYSNYMAGMGYVLSWDLVEYLGNLSLVKDPSEEGHEDKVVGDRLNKGGKAKHRVNKKPLFYDHPEHGGACAHELVKETILVHQVSSPKRWVDVLSFFEPVFLLP